MYIYGKMSIDFLEFNKILEFTNIMDDNSDHDIIVRYKFDTRKYRLGSEKWGAS